MKKFISALKNKLNTASAKTTALLASNRGEGYVDTGLKILIAVVVGALLLGGLYALFGDTIIPTLTAKVKDLFNFKG